MEGRSPACNTRAKPPVPEQGEQSSPTGHSRSPHPQEMGQLKGHPPVKVRCREGDAGQTASSTPRQGHHGRRCRAEPEGGDGHRGWAQHPLAQPRERWRLLGRGSGVSPAEGEQLLWVINVCQCPRLPLELWEHSLPLKVKNMWQCLYFARGNTQTCICTLLQVSVNPAWAGLAGCCETLLLVFCMSCK